MRTRPTRGSGHAAIPRSLIIALCLALAMVVAAGSAQPLERSEVIVQGQSASAAAAAVRRAGGEVTTLLPIVDGVAARVSTTAAARLQADPSVYVTPNDPVTLSETTTSSTTVKSVFTREVGAERMWGLGYDGKDVRVALIDTGVSEVPDLAGKLVPVPHVTREGSWSRCADFSGEGHCEDSYGHGTFIAGLIAGTGASSAGQYRGVAPGAEIVSIKIAGRDGSADVTKVLAAIQYVVHFRKALGIKVLNLSLGTNSRLSYRFDPLNFAVQRAWHSGIVVVVSASNRGPDPETISKPGDDPFVITVGAVDDRVTPAIDDDRMPRFSGRGPTHEGIAKPDIVAPGGRVVGPVSPGSYIEENAPAPFHSHYRRGSGTSFSAGITSGVAALVLQARPGWVPDRVKFAMMNTARKVAERDPSAIGAGLVEAYMTAFESNPKWVAQTWERSQGRKPSGNNLDETRGDVKVERPCSTFEVEDRCIVDGNETARGTIFNRDEYLNSDWDGSSWYATQWAQQGLLGSSWYGSSWYGSSWYGSSWYGSSWYGSTDEAEYGKPIPGSSWYGAWG